MSYEYKGPVDVGAAFDESRVKGKTAIVTGGANGIGEAYVRHLVKAGAFVTVADMDEPRGKALEEELSIKFFKCNVYHWSDQLAVFRSTLSASPTGRIDIVIANAGISGGDSVHFNDLSLDEPEEPKLNVLAVNLVGALYTIKLALFYFRKQGLNGQGQDQNLILQGSVAGYIDFPGAPQYTASKYGLRGIMKSLRWSEVQFGTRTNYIAPWFVKTSILSPTAKKWLESSGTEFADVEDAARCVMRILSDQSINGRAFSIMPRSMAPHSFLDIDIDDYKEGTLLNDMNKIAVNTNHRASLQHQFPEFQQLVSHKIFEARDDIGGTWLVNRYPGVQCDVPAHVYAFPFDPKPDWSHFYATGQDIYAYMKQTAEKWNLLRDVHLNHKVTEAIWREDLGQWKVTVENGGRTITEYADFLVSGQGVLNKWRWPDIKGLDTFKGHKCHSAAWDENYDYSNKRIAVIGNGSSGVQIVPALARLPGTTVFSFQRSPNYVYTHLSPANLLGREDDSQNPPFTEEDKARFCEDKEFHRNYRRKIIHGINSSFKMFSKGSAENAAVTEAARRQMAEALHHDPELCAKLIPEWGLGCRRITPGEGYLESFTKPNVELVTSAVVEATEDSVITADGREFKVDVIACATGFDVSLKPSWSMFGRNGVDLNKEWSVDPESYLSVAARDMPNYFIFLGPNAVIAHGSLLESINWTADYILKWLRKVATENIKSITPKAAVVDELIQYGDEVHKTLIWSDSCTSWFKRNVPDGRITAAFAGSALLFRRLISEIRAEDFDIEYWTGNRWSFMGTGFTEYELNPENDLAWYIEH
ncbi:uncharacterized protein PV07_05117 [Cladophialophora immunda]|uniref:FAD/NAD(P)-binding domain-containing protein n=1 Tax=Cladophialophora immunda TaxID=569365 RepID=A0A0D2AVI9_9EURO|nr:uncharacterized protein PV07_05117 [Cladophialophora immunda]KIW29292.1 hypothetical protein PV07_05117 [Cladophialophora immunda]